MRPNKRRTYLTIISILLVAAASTGLISAAMSGGIVPGVPGVGEASTHSPTATYQGYLGATYHGLYQYVEATPLCRNAFPPCMAPDEAVFYLTSKNGTIRLVFYCGAFSLDYCDSPSQLPFSNGTCLQVKGTLLQPSKWPTNQFNPTMHFNGDLYVFENETLPGTSCS
ncbi:MAG: hypothetical protein ABSF82_01165 [Candidatus Bathyarchaeia archaeon]|jgi:ABC-type antimicrobial peptide transport system permease subunit